MKNVRVREDRQPQDKAKKYLFSSCFQLDVAYREILRSADEEGKEGDLPCWKASLLLTFPFLSSLTVILHTHQ